jgi:hypothetical protein
MPRPSDFGYFQIVLSGEEGDYPALLDISSFLYDFNLLYEFSRLIVDAKYAGYKFSRYSAYRNARRILSEDRLEIESLRVQSPIALIVIVVATPAAAAALWALTQALEKIANFPINREILRLQRDKLRRELASSEGNVLPATPESDVAFREQLRIREADYYFGRVEDHLQDSPVHVKQIEITQVRELSAKHDSNENAKS